MKNNFEQVNLKISKDEKEVLQFVALLQSQRLLAPTVVKLLKLHMQSNMQESFLPSVV
jgi:hypothetical protein